MGALALSARTSASRADLTNEETRSNSCHPHVPVGVLRVQTGSKMLADRGGRGEPPNAYRLHAVFAEHGRRQIAVHGMNRQQQVIPRIL